MSLTEEEQKLDDEARAACMAGNYEQAAVIVIERYGPDLMGFLCAQLPTRADAADAFSQFCEDFWRGLPSFGWRCPIRAWAYTIARHASSRLMRSPHHRAVPLSQASRLGELAERMRESTAPHHRTDVKDRFRELRARLSEFDQTLLILRVDRSLSWSELAVVLSDSPENLDAPALAREAARLRQRFQKVKKRLRDEAEKSGLLDS